MKHANRWISILILEFFLVSILSISLSQLNQTLNAYALVPAFETNRTSVDSKSNITTGVVIAAIQSALYDNRRKTNVIETTRQQIQEKFGNKDIDIVWIEGKDDQWTVIIRAKDKAKACSIVRDPEGMYRISDIRDVNATDAERMLAEAATQNLLSPHDTPATRILKSRIQQKGRITFREFMEISLYSARGYYTSGEVSIGTDTGIDGADDFPTYPELATNTFGQAIAEQLVGMWENMGRPLTFEVVEMGAGNGTMAKTILEYLKGNHRNGLFEAIDYIIVEISPALAQRQKQLLENIDLPISWVLSSDLPLGNIEGVFISNELPDAFPVHIVQKDNREELKEIYVTYETGVFKQELGKLSRPEAIRHYLEMLRRVRGDGYVDRMLKKGMVVNLEMVQWQKAISKSLKTGYVITIDYGFGREPDLSYPFVLRAFSRRSDMRSVPILNPIREPVIFLYKSPGQWDITSDIDFLLLQEIGNDIGLSGEGIVSQGAFFRNICRINPGISNEGLEELEGANGFHVLIQSRGVSNVQLAGLISEAKAAASETEGITPPPDVTVRTHGDEKPQAKSEPIAAHAKHVKETFFTFKDFMDTTMYHPDWGYYGSGQAKIGFGYAIPGMETDFATWPMRLSPIFGELIAKQAYAMWQGMLASGNITRNERFTILEFGAGYGHLARDFLYYVKEQAEKEKGDWAVLYENLEYIIGERSNRMRTYQSIVNAPFLDIYHKIRIIGQDARDISALVREIEQPEEAAAPNPFKGLILSNELIDAFAVHKVRFAQDGKTQTAVVIPGIARDVARDLFHEQFFELALADIELRKSFGFLQNDQLLYLSKEQFIQLRTLLTQRKAEDDIARFNQALAFQETYTDAKAFPELNDYIGFYEERIREQIASTGREITLYINDDARSYMCGIGSLLEMPGRYGYVITIDYGGDSSFIFSSEKPHFRMYGQREQDPYKNPGMYDMTSDVDFTYLAKCGLEANLVPIYFGKQWELAVSKSDNPHLLPTDLYSGDAEYKLMRGLMNMGRRSGDLEGYLRTITDELKEFTEPDTTVRVLIQRSKATDNRFYQFHKPSESLGVEFNDRKTNLFAEPGAMAATSGAPTAAPPAEVVATPGAEVGTPTETITSLTTDEIFLSKIDKLDNFINQWEGMSSEAFEEMEISDDIKKLAKEILILFAKASSLSNLLTPTPQGNKVWRILYISGLLMIYEILEGEEVRKKFKMDIYPVIRFYSILKGEKLDLIVETEKGEEGARAVGLITTGMIKRLSSHPEKFVGIIGHEAMHIFQMGSIKIKTSEEFVESEVRKFLSDIGALVILEHLGIDLSEYLDFIEGDYKRYDERPVQPGLAAVPTEWTPEYQKARDPHYLPRKNIIERILPMKLQQHLNWKQIFTILVDYYDSLIIIDDFQRFIDGALAEFTEREMGSESILSAKATTPGAPTAAKTEKPTDLSNAKLSSDKPSRILENGVEIYEVPIDLKSDKKVMVYVDPNTASLMRSLPAGVKLTFFGSQALEMVRGEGGYIAKEGRLQSGGDIDIYVADSGGLGDELGKRIRENYADIASPSLKSGFFNRAIYQTLVEMYSISRLNVTFITLDTGEFRVSLGDSTTLVSDYEDLSSGVVRYTGNPNNISPASAIQGLIYCARYRMHLEENTSRLIKNVLSDERLQINFGKPAEERLDKLFLKAEDPGGTLEIINQLGLMEGDFFDEICHSFTRTKKIRETILSDKLSPEAMRNFLVRLKIKRRFNELLQERDVIFRIVNAITEDRGVIEGNEYAIGQWLTIAENPLTTPDLLGFAIRGTIDYIKMGPESILSAPPTAAPGTEAAATPETAERSLEKPAAPPYILERGTKIKMHSGKTYIVLEKLIEGKLSFMYKVEDEMDKSIKVLKISSDDFEANETIEREFAVLNHLSRFQPHHPNIVQVCEDGERNGYYYYVMEFIEGENLGNIWEIENDKITAERFWGWLRNTVEALGYCHSHGVTWVDIKPANIMEEKETGRVVLIDAGRAIKSDKPNPTGDIYEVGRWLSFWLFGQYIPLRRTYESAVINILATKQLGRQAVDRLGEEFLMSIADIVRKATDAEAHDRYKNTEEMLNDIPRPAAQAAMPPAETVVRETQPSESEAVSVPKVIVRVGKELSKLIGKSEIEARGNTIGEVIKDLIRQYPEIEPKLYDADKLIALISINNEASTDFNALIKEGDKVKVMLPISGGSGAMSRSPDVLLEIWEYLLSYLEDVKNNKVVLNANNIKPDWIKVLSPMINQREYARELLKSDELLLQFIKLLFYEFERATENTGVPYVNAVVNVEWIINDIKVHLEAPDLSTQPKSISVSTLATAGNPTYMAFCLLFGTGIDLRKIDDSQYIGLLARSYGVSEDSIKAALKEFQVKGPRIIVNDTINMIRKFLQDGRVNEPEFFVLNVLAPYLMFVNKGHKLQPKLEREVLTKFSQIFKIHPSWLEGLVKGVRSVKRRSLFDMRRVDLFIKGIMMGYTFNEPLAILNEALKPYSLKLRMVKDIGIVPHRISANFHIGIGEIDDILIVEGIGPTLLEQHLGTSTALDKDVDVVKESILRNLEDIDDVVNKDIESLLLDIDMIPTWSAKAGIDMKPHEIMMILQILCKKDFEGFDSKVRFAKVAYDTGLHETKHKWDENLGVAIEMHDIDEEISALLTQVIFGVAPYEGLGELIGFLMDTLFNIKKDNKTKKTVVNLTRQVWQLAVGVSTGEIDEDILRRELRKIYEDYRCIGNGKNLSSLTDFEQNVVSKLKDLQTFL